MESLAENESARKKDSMEPMIAAQFSKSGSGANFTAGSLRARKPRKQSGKESF